MVRIKPRVSQVLQTPLLSGPSPNTLNKEDVVMTGMRGLR